MSWTNRNDSRPRRVRNIHGTGQTRLLRLYSGIWMCRDKSMNVMVMDVEGTDGRERGEDQVRHAGPGLPGMRC